MNFNLKCLNLSSLTYHFPLFILCLLMFGNSGFYLKYIPPLSPVYIFFYLAFPFLFLILLRKKSFRISQPALWGFCWIAYVVVFQFLLQGRPVAILGSIATVLFFILGTIFLPKLTKEQNYFICDFIFLLHFIIYGLDTLYRLYLFHFDVLNLMQGANFYPMKINCFLYGDTNPLGVSTTVLTFFALYLYNKTRLQKYLFYFITFAVFTYLSFSRSAIIAIILTLGLLLIYISTLVILKSQKNIDFWVVSLKKIFAYIALIIISIISFFVVTKIVIYLQTDSSFSTKMDIINDTFCFLQTASPRDILFGIGFNNGRINEFSESVGYAHTYLATYIMETGIFGYLIMTTFLVSILIKCKKAIYLLFPFFIMGFSYIGHAQLHLFYTLLAFIYYFEKILPKQERINDAVSINNSSCI